MLIRNNTKMLLLARFQALLWPYSGKKPAKTLMSHLVRKISYCQQRGSGLECIGERTLRTSQHDS